MTAPPAPVGLAAGLMLLAAPGIRLNAEEYMLDLPLASMVVVSVWALLASDGFARRDRSLVFGVLAGAGMLTKWTFFLFLALPVVLALGTGLAASSGASVPPGRRWGNFALALLAGGLVAAPYYLPIFPVLVSKTIFHSRGAADWSNTLFTPAASLYHIETLSLKIFGWPFTLNA